MGIPNFEQMNILGNIFWLLFGGILIGLCYFMVGLLFCITIIGIPFGVQLFKIGSFVMWPFGSKAVDGEKASGCLSIFMNVIWILFGGIEIATMHLCFGLIFCLTIVGIPLGMKHFELALLALIPFGRKIVAC